jgi:mannose-6-phosphate isomerase-like protein (cupin superfamily)
MEEASFFHIAELEKQREGSGKRYQEFLRIPAMSAGVYVVSAGGTDPQKPHKEDELYFVVRGKAKIRVGEESRAVHAGSMIFVAASVAHRFHDIEEELVVVVFFAPAESE